MKIKALWGWTGAKGTVRTGDIIEVSDEYGHLMIGKGLAEAVESKPAAKQASNKQASPKETK